MNGKKVVVAMSGGVDSAGAALLLREAGYEVSGVTLRLHRFAGRNGLCGSDGEIAAAQAAARALGLPHSVVDLCPLFRSAVMDRFVAEYAAGRTPNPCVDCNRSIKFGALLDWALEHGADFLATGHYARVRCDAVSGRWQLLRGRDGRKDQSYVLYPLTQRQLSHLLLPVGEYEKAAIRKKAAECALPNAQKPDSQDICFVPDGNYVRFLREYGGLDPVPGDFVDEGGRVLGRHRGQECYTLGQRRGLGVSADEPLYVVRKGPAGCPIVLGPESALYSDTLIAGSVNWVGIPQPDAPLEVTAKTRYSQREAAAVVEPLADGSARVRFAEPQRAVTPGQSVVFYLGDLVAGGGVIQG